MTTVAATAPLLRPGRTCWAVSPANTSGLLIDGRDYFREFYRAAKAARRHILLAGWQFDTTVSLLRGKDRENASEDVRLLPFLKNLCRKNPELRIYVICWDYSPAFFFEREWLQDFKFNRGSRRRIRFRFDDRHALGASHHQKFAVVDGSLAFVGSLDFCHARWDLREHSTTCPDRCQPDGEDVSGPYHEVQAYLTGPAVSELQELFEARWILSGGKPLQLAPRRPVPVDIRPSARIGAADVGFSRTVAETTEPEHPPIREIRQLFVDAIATAERSIYIENQYFESRAVYDALRDRMLRAEGPPLDIAMIYPRELHSFSEELMMGAQQSAMFRSLKGTAAARGHRLGIYCSMSAQAATEPKARYIHSKVMIVDDRFLTVGSANTNNRSMGLDSELHVSWEVPPAGDPELARAIRRARLNLLVEHSGLPARRALRELREPADWMGLLERWATEERGALRHHPMSSRMEQNPLLITLSAGDPLPDGGPGILGEESFEAGPSPKERAASALRRLRRMFRSRIRRPRTAATNLPGALAHVPTQPWAFLVRMARRWMVPLLILSGIGLLIWVVNRILDALR
jgi:phospholipase D1/2